MRILHVLDHSLPLRILHCLPDKGLPLMTVAWEQV